MRAFAVALATGLAATAHAQLRPDQVLVVYDSRFTESRLVAEHYAGSAKVPGGLGGLPGTRPGVRVLDLAAVTPPAPLAADVSYTQFIERYRNPLRAHLASTDAPRTVRCIALTKGLAHRIYDLSSPVIGDNPVAAEGTFFAGNYTAASVDAELTLLWQSLTTGEAGGGGDSPADGAILNPYARQGLPVSAFSALAQRSTKAFIPIDSPPGVLWTTPTPASAGAAALTPGDLYLVCRLDGPTVATVRAALERAASLVVNTETALLLLDESNSNGLADPAETDELDNLGPAPLRAGDDYETARNALLADGRFNPANVRYNRLAGANEFFVGPRLEFEGQGLLLSGPVLLLATEGANHGVFTGAPTLPPGAGTLYPLSFKYAPGAVFNSIESANGRNFNGIGGNFGQAQIADFLSAGGTFAIGNVWEPFAWTVADNTPIVRGFFLGNLSWAEAAYAALPALSFQQIVVGDPLARPTRTSDDLDGDGQITLDDLHAFERAPRDLNRDGLVNAADRHLIESSVRGFAAAAAKADQR